MVRTAGFSETVCTVIVLALLCTFSMAAHSSDKNTSARPASTLTNDLYRPFLINNVFNYYGNNGSGSFTPFGKGVGAGEGFELPKGSRSFMVFQDGIVWGGRHKGRTVAKVGGSQYTVTLQAGPLLTNGTAGTDPVPANAADPKHRLYRVRPDVRPDIPFAAVEAMLNAEEVPLIGRYESVSAQLLYDGYITDWNEWPAAAGAPFKDVNGNGAYDPTVDVPGQPDADQTLWFVANDMNDSLTQRFAGCPPIGIEMQRTIWGYRRGGVLGNTIFISTVLINKSGAPVDSMYITQWSDPDLGNAGDDHVGCDTTLDIGYAYNGRALDATYGVNVPAAGFAFIQGPMVPGAPTDTALFRSSRRPGFRNLRMSSFVAFVDGFHQFTDPARGTNGDLQWYRLMQGTDVHAGHQFLDINTLDTTRFCFSGDPVKSTTGGAGWVDGQAPFVPSDRRMCMSTGPFTFANGDTQQVVVACLASQGTDRLTSITALRSDVRTVQSFHRNRSLGRRMPLVSCSVARDTAQAAVTFHCDARQGPLVAAAIELTTATGWTVATVPLADDGLHDDGAAGDGVWAGMEQVPVQNTGMKAGALLMYPGGETIALGNVLDHITTVPVSVVSFEVASDNINSDGIANPGENVRYSFSLKNDASLAIPNLAATPAPFTGNGKYTIPVLPAHGQFELHYDANVPGSYFVFDVPNGYQDTTMRMAIMVTDDSANVWRDTLVFPVRPLPGPVSTSPLRHISGKASGSFVIRIADPLLVKDHLYVLRAVDSAGVIGAYSLKDSTAGLVLFDGHAPPDSLGHESPVVDGFKVLRGTIDTSPGMRSWAVPQGTLRFSPAGGFRGIGLEGFSDASFPDAYDPQRGTIGAAMHTSYGGIGSTLTVADCRTVLLKLAAVDNNALWDPRAVPADTNMSRGYRFLRGVSPTSSPAKPEFAPWIIRKESGFPYQDYNFSVPFSAWDMETDPPTRLAVGHLENNLNIGRLDGRYWPGPPTTDNSGARELAFIFRSPYTDTPDPALTVNLSNNATTPLIWVMACARSAGDVWPGTDQFMIIAHHFPSSEDAWVFNPSVVVGVQQAEHPLRFALLQNYPNPFNPVTTIRYELPAQSEVTITVYDVLGRAVRHLIREVQSAGSHTVLWHADTDAGGSVASGVYFYRCTVGQSDRGGKFDQTMKMIVLR